MRLAALLLIAGIPLQVPAADPPAPGEDLFPLAVGNTWTYKVDKQDERFVVRVARQEMIGSQTCFLLEGRLRERVVATEHLAFTTDGLTRFRADKEDVVPPVTVLKMPNGRRTDWSVGKYQLGERGGSARFWEFNAGGEMVVPAGRYRGGVIVNADVTSEAGMRTTTLWYAPGVGLVKQTIGDPKRPPFFTMELEKFDQSE
jgi:hypothetical protein